MKALASHRGSPHAAFLPCMERGRVRELIGMGFRSFLQRRSRPRMTSQQPFFHVDRAGSLAGDAQLQPLPLRHHDGDIGALRAMFPGGMSQWGMSMLFDDTALTLTVEALANHAGLVEWDGTDALLSAAGQGSLRASKDRVVELLAEAVRLLRAPRKPSRLGSLFAYESLDVAKQFRIEQSTETAPIWELLAPKGAAVHRGDSTLVGVPVRASMLLTNLALYWDGFLVPGGQPTNQEVLVPLPAAVVRRVA